VWGWWGGRSAVEERVSWGREKDSEGRGLTLWFVMMALPSLHLIERGSLLG
jgi:hypothetical protein